MKRRRVVERSEKSRVHQVSVTEILRNAQDDNLIREIHFTPSSFFYFFNSKNGSVLPLVESGNFPSHFSTALSWINSGVMDS